MLSKSPSFTSLVYVACMKIPKGKFSTYYELARFIDKPKSVRAVGNALNKNNSGKVPCHRVVRSDGTIGGFASGSEEKVKILLSEGIRISGGKITDWSQFYKF